MVYPNHAPLVIFLRVIHPPTGKPKTKKLGHEKSESGRPKILGYTTRWVTAYRASVRRILYEMRYTEGFDNFLYRYLISLFASREARLDSLAAGGRPQGQLPSSDGSLRDPGSG